MKKTFGFFSMFCRVGLLYLLLALLGAYQSWAVNLNEASIATLQNLPGIGPKTAALIVEERERGGAFTSLDDLSARVRGIGPKKKQALQEAGLFVGGQRLTATKDSQKKSK